MNQEMKAAESFNYHTVKPEVQSRIRAYLKRENCILIFAGKKSNYKGDHFLYMLIAKGRYNNAYHVFSYSDAEGCRGLNGGSYNLSFPAALIEMGSRSTFDPTVRPK